MPRLIPVAIAVLIVTAVSTTHAVSDDGPDAPAGQTERTVLGWTDDGSQLVVRRTSGGERMVSGRSKDFYFELTELRDGSSGELAATYRHGEPSGASHPTYERAAKPSEAEGALDETKRAGAVRQWHSPNGGVALTTYARRSTEVIEDTPRGTQYRCVRTQRLVGIARERDEVAILEEWTEKGDRSTRRRETFCPEITVEAYWHPDGGRWAVVREVTLSGAQVRPPEVYAGRAEFASAETTAPVLRPGRLLGSWMEDLGDAPLREGYVALHEGRVDEARQKFESADADHDDARISGFAAGGLARVAAREGDADAVDEQLERVRELLADEPIWIGALTAACYRRLGRIDRSDRELEQLRELSDSPFDLFRATELFRFYDLEVSNRLLIAQLGEAGASYGDGDFYAHAYGLLIEGLIDAGRYEKAAILIDKLSEVPPGVQAQKLRADFEGAEPGALDLESFAERTVGFLFEQPGSCTGYLIAGRVRARQGQIAAARRQFRAAHVCEAGEPAAAYYLGALAFRTGDWEEAEAHLEQYLARAVERRGDPLRDRRRARAENYRERIAHEGIVLTAVDCGPHPLSGILCRGVVENTTDETIESVTARAVRVGEEEDELVSATIDEIGAGASRTFGLRLTRSELADVRIEAGRGAEEMEMNRMPALFR